MKSTPNSQMSSPRKSPKKTSQVDMSTGVEFSDDKLLRATDYHRTESFEKLSEDANTSQGDNSMAESFASTESSQEIRKEHPRTLLENNVGGNVASSEGTASLQIPDVNEKGDLQDVDILNEDSDEIQAHNNLENSSTSNESVEEYSECLTEAKDNSILQSESNTPTEESSKEKDVDHLETPFDQICVTLDKPSSHVPDVNKREDLQENIDVSDEDSKLSQEVEELEVANVTDNTSEIDLEDIDASKESIQEFCEHMTKSKDGSSESAVCEKTEMVINKVDNDEDNDASANGFKLIDVTLNTNDSVMLSNLTGVLKGTKFSEKAEDVCELKTADCTAQVKHVEDTVRTTETETVADLP